MPNDFEKLKSKMDSETTLLAPIIVSVYNRPLHFQRCIESLKASPLARHSELFVISDAPGRPQDSALVEEVRRIADSIEGFRQVHVVKRATNFGFLRSLTEAISKVSKEFGEYIFLEDDIEVSPAFLAYLNGGLDYYQNRSEVYSISAYCPPSAAMRPEADRVLSVHAAPYSCPWGYATWVDRHGLVDWTLNNYPAIKADSRLRHFLARESLLMLEVLREDHVRGLDAIDVRVSCQMLAQSLVSIYPSASLTRNHGFDGSGEHMGTDPGMAVQKLCGSLDLGSWEYDPVDGFALQLVRAGTKVRFGGILFLLNYFNLRDAFDPLIQGACTIYKWFKKKRR